MNGLEKEYYEELKKNNKLVRIYEIVKKLDNINIDFNVIRVEMNKKLNYVKKNIKNWTKAGNEDEIYNFLYSVFYINKYIYGALLAFDRNIYTGDQGIVYNEEYKLFSPVVYKEQNGEFNRYVVDLYNYTSGDWEWWTVPYESKQPYMTKPFKGSISKFDIIVHSFPIIVEDIFYGLFSYIFDFQKINKICSYV